MVPQRIVSVLLLSTIALLIARTSGEAVVITAENIEAYKAAKTVLLLNFYADWCRYSTALKPIYDKTADQIHAEKPEALVGKVDCDNQKHLCQNVFHITKYPTLKLMRNGEIMRKEYRGQRSVDALTAFVNKQLLNPVEVTESYSDIVDKVQEGKCVVGYFSSNDSNQYNIFHKVAYGMRDDCKFYAVINPSTSEPQMAFREKGAGDNSFAGDFNSFDVVKKWISDVCVPLVREITFENGEELTEEGVPFLIYFYNPDEPEQRNIFRQKVESELLDQKGSINCVTADGVKFAHPLSHLGKSKKDLPLIAIDSFRHMYVFPTYSDIHIPGKLKQFVEDLHSGKLHREFHYGPDQPQVKQQEVKPEDPTTEKVEQKRNEPSEPQLPPESSFKKLAPAKSRYTLLKRHDEL